MWIWIWLGVAVVSIVIEFLTMDLLSCWFILGAGVALILAALGVPVYIQVIVAIVLSLICLLCFRRMALKLLNRDKFQSNVNALVGQSTKLLTAISEDSNGSLRINDVVWTAKTADGTALNEGERVTITEVKGNSLYVVKEVTK